MSDFTPDQQRAVMTYYRHFQERLGDENCDPQSVAALLAEVFPDADPEKLLLDCRLMEAGVQRFQRAYGNADVDSEAGTAEAIDNLTKEMNEQQRKGFYLSLYDTLRESDLHECGEAAQAGEGRALVREAGLSESELKELVTEQLHANALVMAAECAEEDLEEDAMEDAIPDPMLLAAANYAASMDGTLPEHYEKSPEMVGIFAAASSEMARKIRENPEMAKNSQWVSKVVVGVLGVALIVALVAWCAPAAIEGVTQVAVAIKTGNVGILLARYKYPLIVFLKQSRHFIPAAAVAAMSGLSGLAQEGMQKLRGLYGKVRGWISARRSADQKAQVEYPGLEAGTGEKLPEWDWEDEADVEEEEDEFL